MTMSKSYTRLFAESWKALFFAGIFGALLSVLFSFLVTPLQYASSVRVLITQPNAAGLDPYTAIKSTERIATSLSELIYTTTFSNNTLAQAQGFDANYFPTNEYARRKAWNNSIETSVVAGTGIMTLSAFHPNREQARILVDAAARELALEAPNYFGYSTRIQVIDAPLPSRWFARPHFLTDSLFGFFAGLLTAVIWTLVRLPRRTTDF